MNRTGTMKYCEDCRWYERTKVIQDALCLHEKSLHYRLINQGLAYVSRKSQTEPPVYYAAKIERQFSNGCGPTGEYWEERRD